MLIGTYSVPGEGLLPRISRIWRGWRTLCWRRGVWRRQVCTVFHLMVIIIGGWCHWKKNKQTKREGHQVFSNDRVSIIFETLRGYFGGGHNFYKGSYSQNYVFFFSVVMYRGEGWAIKKAGSRRIDTFECGAREDS